MEYDLRDLESKYYLELDKIVEKVNDEKIKSVLLQLPDGLKPWGLVISDYLDGNAEFMIWLGDCFGACDLPDSSCELIVQFGHSEW